MKHHLKIGTRKYKMWSDITKVSNRAHMKSSRIGYPKIHHLAYWLLWAVGSWKNSKCRERLSLNSPYLPKDRPSKRTSIVLDPIAGSFINKGRLTLHSKGEQKLTPSPERLCHNCTFHLSPHSSFLIIYSLLKGLHPLSPFPIKMIRKPEF